jgi:hypothetical protein
MSEGIDRASRLIPASPEAAYRAFAAPGPRYAARPRSGDITFTFTPNRSKP